jgi:hypothetical protein
VSGGVVFQADNTSGLDRLAARVAAEPPDSGNGHGIILWAAATAAEEGHGLAETEAALLAAVRTWDHPDPNARTTIRSGWRKVESEGRLGQGSGIETEEPDIIPPKTFCMCPAKDPTSPECVCPAPTRSARAVVAAMRVDPGAVVVAGVTLAPQRLSMLDRTPPAPLLLDRLDPIESTILYGPGGVGKGALTCGWIKNLVGDGHDVLILDYENHGGEWARRLFGLGGPDILDHVTWIAPLALGLGAIWDHGERVREWCHESGATYVVIDSAVMAAGGQDPMKPETPSKYNAALQGLYVPSLTLAHVTKLHDARYPFGSVFWHNLARVTWSLMPKGEDTILACRKANNYQKPQASAVTLTWHNDMLRSVGERPAVFTLEDRIAEVLAAGESMTPSAITDALNDGLPGDEHVARGTITSALSRGLARRGASYAFTVADGAWRRRAETDD